MPSKRNSSRKAVPTNPRIAILSHAHPSVSKGGAEIAAHSLFTGLLLAGADTIFIAACDKRLRSRIELASDREFAVFYDAEKYDHFYHLALPEVWQQISHILEVEKVQLANFHHFLNFGINTVKNVATIAKVPVVMTFHEFLALCHHHGQMVTYPARMLCEAASPSACTSCFPEHASQQFNLRKRLFTRTFDTAAACISPSQFLADRVSAWGVPVSKLNVIENGLYRVPELAPISGRADGKPWVFGYFGQITPFKGMDTVLRAAEFITDKSDLADRIEIRIHGNLVGQTEEFTKRFSSTLKQFNFLTHVGPYNNENVGRLMRECDYVLIPSTWWENSPVVIQEAYAARRPVICTGIGGMAEKVRDGVSGLHFRRNDHVDLARVFSMAANDELFGRLQAGIPHVGDSLCMARQYLKIFGDILAGTSTMPSKYSKFEEHGENRSNISATTL